MLLLCTHDYEEKECRPDIPRKYRWAKNDHLHQTIPEDDQRGNMSAMCTQRRRYSLTRVRKTVAYSFPYIIIYIAKLRVELVLAHGKSTMSRRLISHPRFTPVVIPSCSIREL